jgi:hypothetical protein
VVSMTVIAVSMARRSITLCDRFGNTRRSNFGPLSTKKRKGPLALPGGRCQGPRSVCGCIGPSYPRPCIKEIVSRLTGVSRSHCITGPATPTAWRYPPRLILAELPGGGELRAMKQNAPNAIHNENLQQQLRRVPKQIVNPDS